MQISDISDGHSTPPFLRGCDPQVEELWVVEVEGAGNERTETLNRTSHPTRCLPAHHPAGVGNKETQTDRRSHPPTGRQAGAGELIVNSMGENKVQSNLDGRAWKTHAS